MSPNQEAAGGHTGAARPDNLLRYGRPVLFPNLRGAAGPHAPCAHPSLRGRGVPGGGGAVRGRRRGLVGLAVGAGGRCRLFCSLIGLGLDKGRCLGEALWAGIGLRKKRA